LGKWAIKRAESERIKRYVLERLLTFPWRRTR
jgi:hypothetical protein